MKVHGNITHARSGMVAPRPSNDVRGMSFGGDGGLDAYLREVQRHPVLPQDQQVSLARLFLAGEQDAGAKLVTANLRLVVKIAREMKKSHGNLLDLVQEGNLGLMHAVRKFDPERGVKLSTYAAWWIRAYMLRFILRNQRLVRLETSHVHRRLFFKLRREMSKLEARGEEISPAKLAEEFDVQVSDIEEMIERLSTREVSVEQPVSRRDDSGMSILDTLTDGSESIDEEVSASERTEMLHRKITEFGEQLKGRDKVLFQERLVADEPQTLRDLGAELGVSRERVRQLEMQLRDKLERFLRKELPEELLVAA